MKGQVYPFAFACALAGCRTLLGFEDGVVQGDAAKIDDGKTPDVSDDATNAPAWWNPDWRLRSRITIDTTQLTGPVAAFPVLVRLGAFAPGTVSATGADLRFVLDDQATVVPYEIERFSNTSAEIWVRVPALSPGSLGTKLWLYRNNPMATPSSNAASVFGMGNVSVHHLGVLDDATGNGHTATGGFGTPTVGAGIVGSGRAFNGVNAYLSLAGESAYDFTATMTVSAWVRVASFDVDWQAIVTKGDTTWRLQRNFSGNNGSIGSTTQMNIYNLAGTSSINDNGWHQVVGVHDGTMQRLYVDGNLENSVAFTGLLDRNDLAVAIGRNEESSVPRYWNGSIDEVRITSTARDAGWIKAEHATIASTTFVTVGPDEAAP